MTDRRHLSLLEPTTCKQRGDHLQCGDEIVVNAKGFSISTDRFSGVFDER
jgi:hypothetical protein